MPSARGQPAEETALGGFGVEVEILRIELRRERHDRLRRHGQLAGNELVADLQVVEVQGFSHPNILSSRALASPRSQLLLFAPESRNMPRKACVLDKNP